MGKTLQRMFKGNITRYATPVILTGAILGYGVADHKKEQSLQAEMNELRGLVIQKENQIDYLNNEFLKLKSDFDKSNKREIEIEKGLKGVMEENKALLALVEKSEIEKKQESKQKEQELNKAQDDGDWENFTQTHYTSYCTGCSGKTASGIDVKSSITYEGYNIIAVDPNVIKLGSIVEINDGKRTFKAIAGDTGGAIKGNKIDLLVSISDSSYAYSLGVKKIKLKVVRNGWG